MAVQDWKNLFNDFNNFQDVDQESTSWKTVQNGQFPDPITCMGLETHNLKISFSNDIITRACKRFLLSVTFCCVKHFLN